MRGFASIGRWSLVLVIALVAPINLPAGGLDRLKPLVRQRQRCCPLIVSERSSLLSSPFVLSPILLRLESGTPLKVLRHWKSNDGRNWLQVQLASSSFLDVGRVVKRGWLLV